jgi:hypothetical protein
MSVNKACDTPDVGKDFVHMFLNCCVEMLNFSSLLLYAYATMLYIFQNGWY